mmetsp:Transcript_14993/g.16641  ORF Transcript_14993/g.16641 Transcript_14993/m.16641 type:complete len:182 (-) Transcript_14993:1213-1758(-)
MEQLGDLPVDEVFPPMICQIEVATDPDATSDLVLVLVDGIVREGGHHLILIIAITEVEEEGETEEGTTAPVQNLAIMNTRDGEITEEGVPAVDIVPHREKTGSPEETEMILNLVAGEETAVKVQNVVFEGIDATIAVTEVRADDPVAREAVSKESSANPRVACLAHRQFILQNRKFSKTRT